MVYIQAGWFWMGSDDSRAAEAPRHCVFTDAFRISPTTVTRHEYAVFLELTDRTRPRGWEEPSFAKLDQPVVGVSWFDAVAYCEWLSERSASTFRLPREAEWERACRGGVDGMPYAWGHDPPESLEYFQGVWSGPRPVAQGSPNGYGLFNMGDNVHEWCADWYRSDYYAISPTNNPRGPESGDRRVSRGGSWRHMIKASRAAQRSSLPPDYRYTDYGFRIAQSIPEDE
jgi:sulfatase modifying factor 1